MLRNFFRITYRNLRKNIIYSAIVTIGLALGFVTLLALIQWAGYHMSFDKHFENAESIYRLSLKEKGDNFQRHTARIIHGDIVNQIDQIEIPDMQDFVRIAPFRNAIISHNDIMFYEKDTYASDPSFLEVFNPEFIQGSSHDLLDAPYKVALSESTAKKYFGNDDPIGENIKIAHQFSESFDNYEITGIFKDFPKNTHFNISILTSFDDPDNYSSTAWVYILLKEHANPVEVKNKISDYIKENNNQELIHNIDIQLFKLTDIHLKSHLAREIGKNVKVQNIYSLLIAGILVFILAWFNFTLLSVSQNQVNIKRLIYQWQTGASKSVFFRQFLVEFITIGLIGFIIAIFLTFSLKGVLFQLFGISVFHNVSLLLFTLIGLLALLLCSSFITSMYATKRLYRNLKTKYFASQHAYHPSGSSKNWFIKSVIALEFIITFILISNLLSINHQLKYSISNQLGANQINSIQIPDLPRPVIDKFALFRDKLISYPGIEVTAMMEEPGGMAMDAFYFSVEGYPDLQERLFVFPVEENFLRFYHLELIAGEDFPMKYDISDTTEYYILNETAAKMLDKEYENIIGRELNLDFPYEGIIFQGDIVGVVRDFHLSDMNLEISPMVIWPEYTWLYCFSIRFSGNVQEGILTTERIWEEIFPQYPFRYFYTAELYENLYNEELTEIKALIVFSILSIIIAGMGLFALSGFFMNQKLPPAAIRKIHGAEIRHILIPEIKQYIFLSIAASLIAFPISLFTIQQWKNNFVYQADTQYWLFPAITLFMIAFACTSVAYQALKVSRLDPVKVINSN